MRFWHLTWHCFKKSNKGIFRTPSWSSQFFRLLLRLKVFRSTKLKYLYDSNAEQGRSQDFSKGGGGVTEATHQIVSRIIATWRPILTKDKSRWRKYLTKKQILKMWAFQQWLLRPRYCHGVFATWILRLFAQKKAYQGGGGVTGTPGPP